MAPDPAVRSGMLTSSQESEAQLENTPQPRFPESRAAIQQSTVPSFCPPSGNDARLLAQRFVTGAHNRQALNRVHGLAASTSSSAQFPSPTSRCIMDLEDRLAQNHEQDDEDLALSEDDEANITSSSPPANPFLYGDEWDSESESAEDEDVENNASFGDGTMGTRTSVLEDSDTTPPATSRANGYAASAPPMETAHPSGSITSPNIQSGRLHRSMTAMSRRFRSLAPDVQDPAGLVGRILGSASHELDGEGLFVKAEPDMSDNEQDHAFNIDAGDEGASNDEETEEIGHEEFQMFEKIYEKQKAAGNIKYNDRLDFEFIQNAYWRSLRKRKAEGSVNHEELSTAKRNALRRESRLSEIVRRNQYRSQDTKRSTELDRAGKKKAKSTPRERQRVDTPEIHAQKILKKYYPANDNVSPAHEEMEWAPTRREPPPPDRQMPTQGSAQEVPRHTHAFDHRSERGHGHESIGESAENLNREPRKSHARSPEITVGESDEVAQNLRRRRRRGEMPPPEMTGADNITRGDIFRSAMTGGVKGSSSIRADTLTAEPTFIHPESADALARMIIGGQEKAPATKRKRRTPDEIKLARATVNFHVKNKPKLTEGCKYRLARMESTLEPHQMIGVSWMRWRELAPQEPFGGILADEMGLGKTIEMLAVITDGLPDNTAKKMGCTTTLIVVPLSILKQWQDEIKRHCKPEFIGKVLVYHGFDITKKTNAPVEFLQSYDVILTTYDEVYKSYPHEEYPKAMKDKAARDRWWADHFEETKGPLYRIHFHRLVIDECQCVKNPRGEYYEGVKALQATNRWLMSGTPIVDKTQEIYAYYRIIHKAYTGNLKTFNANFLSKRARNAEERLNCSMNNFILRRTNDDILNGQKLLQLPRAKEVRIMCELSDFEKASYVAVLQKYEALIARADANEQPVFPLILCMITSVQQLISSPLLIQNDFAELPASVLSELVKVYQEQRKKDSKQELRLLQAKYSIDSSCGIGHSYGAYPPWTKYKSALEAAQVEARNVSTESCDACGQTPAHSRCIPCGHILCSPCASEAQEDIDGDVLYCCRECGANVSRLAGIDHQHLDSAQQSSKKKTKKKHSHSAEQWWPKLAGLPMPSSKVLVIKLKLLEWLHQDPAVKIVIFTQYLGMVEHLKKLCDFEKWTYTELTGKVTKMMRDRNIERFMKDSSINILLATTKTGGTGLNLTNASKVLITDGWWNEASDQQAMARVWRHGQTREVEVVRIYMKGSIDARKITLRKGKTEAIMKLAMKGIPGMPRDNIMKLFKPAETKQEVKAGGFLLVDDTKIPDRRPNPSKEDTSSDQGEDEISSDSEAEEFNELPLGRSPSPLVAPRARRRFS